MGAILDKMFDNPDFWGAVLFCLSAGVGQVLHFIKKWAEGDAGWVTTNIRRSVAAAIGNLGGMIVFIQTGVLGPILQLPNGPWAVFLFGFLNGFTADSALNKSLREAEQKEKQP